MIKTIEYEGKVFKVEDGFLVNPADWCEEWVEYVRKQEGIECFTNDHLRVLLAIRGYYEINGVSPMVRVLCRITGLKMKVLYELFPNGPSKVAARMAGTKPSPLV
jgi:tRNA 2-thiouridine synthesizing protein E